MNQSQLSPKSRIANDTKTLKETLLVTEQLEHDLSDLNVTIHEQGDQMRGWKRSLDQSNRNLDNTNDTLNQMRDRWCLIS